MHNLPLFFGSVIISWIVNNSNKKKEEKLRHKKKLTVYHNMHIAEKQKFWNMIKATKTDHYKGKIQEFSSDQGQIFWFIVHLRNTEGKPTLPERVVMLF